LIYRKIHHSEWTLVASQGHIEKHGLARSPTELTHQPSVGALHEINDVQHHEHVNWLDRKIMLVHRFGVNNMTSVLIAIKADLGFGIVPRNMVRKELEQQQLVEISQDIDIKQSSLYAVYRKRCPSPPPSYPCFGRLISL
jgi:DNA-binding transcriptional LysR family regulator